MSQQREWYRWGIAFLACLLLLGYASWQWSQVSLREPVAPVIFPDEKTALPGDRIDIFSPATTPDWTSKLAVSGIVYSNQPSSSYVVIKDDTGQHNYREGEALVNMPMLKVKQIKPAEVEIQTPQGEETVSLPPPVYAR